MAVLRQLHLCLLLLDLWRGLGLSVKSSAFLGRSLATPTSQRHDDHVNDAPTTTTSRRHALLVMRKQKASDRRTRRRQRGLMTDQDLGPLTVTESPMKAVGPWRGKAIQPRDFGRPVPTVAAAAATAAAAKTGGRGRSRKRSTLYNNLSHYHNHFLGLLTHEYQVETGILVTTNGSCSAFLLQEDEVLSRIKTSIDNPLVLEQSGYALFDLFPSRRGNLFSDEVYRFSKASDATVIYPRALDLSGSSAGHNETGLPSNHRFSKNDVIMITLQPSGSGDYYNPASLPTSELAVSVEARVLNTGPTYIDVAMTAGKFEAAFGPAPNDRFHPGDVSMRLRMDRFFSKVPYERMVQALGQMTSIPSRRQKPDDYSADDGRTSKKNYLDAIVMDEVIRETILSTHAYSDPQSPLFGDSNACNLSEIANKLSKPPMRTSHTLTAGVMSFIKSRAELFKEFNAPQQAAIEAALTRRLTMIQGPPGTGKTTVAAAIAFGFAKQCRAISPHTKVLACAFSNVGADNLAEAMVHLGLRVVRIGKASAISESLWNITLDAAIDRDEDAAKALGVAARATAKAARLGLRARHGLIDRAAQDAATDAVMDARRACNIAATKALREADVIVSTSSGAADPRLLAACGILSKDSVDFTASDAAAEHNGLDRVRELAPDQLAPLSLPFVLVDEACQSVEPATLIPILSSNSCRALVMLGDPCQLPPTVRSIKGNQLSLSLMERLSVALPRPIVSAQVDMTIGDVSFTESLAIKQSKSLLRSMESGLSDRSYQKRFGGALLLSVQYRMHPSIAAFPSAIFYDGLLSTPAFLASVRYFPAALQRLMPSSGLSQCVRVLDVGGRGNERQGSLSPAHECFTESIYEQTSYWNGPEATRVLSILKDVLRGNDTRVESIGVISPYNGQVQLIRSMMADDKELRQLLQARPRFIEVNSVDGYQGRERDVIIFSSVRSNRHGRIGFLHDWRRMNVAMTRARSAFLFVGDLETLSTDKHWAAFGKYARILGIVS